MLKNYTSEQPAERSISFIETKLVAHGARQILKLYNDNNQVSGLCFNIPIDGQVLPFKLPARLDQCEKILTQNLSRRCKPETKKRIPEQSARTAWKNISDWVDAQMALIEMSQVEITEVFMPYLYDTKKNQTCFEMMKERGFKALLPAADINHE
jgi:hypothetical protein